MAKDDTTALKRQLVALAQDAVRVRSSGQRLTFLLQLIKTAEALIQGMTTDCDVKVRVYLDGEEVTRAQDVPQPTLPAVRGGEHLIVRDEGRFKEVPDEAPNFQMPRPVVAAMHALSSLADAHDIKFLAQFCGYSAERQKWTGISFGSYSPESLPYLAAGLRDSLQRAQAEAGKGEGRAE